MIYSKAYNFHVSYQNDFDLVDFEDMLNYFQHINCVVWAASVQFINEDDNGLIFGNPF
ncbi:hypothetical protein CHUV0807_2388 [Cardiobacterium hominis]|uniref:Uncharacterized protein n=1 Tax=Cardiobacterium hominis TaxID=2718 RepID=A0A1C3H721_9GAMM|nr:hypothetical protein CHUV0807_2388 [Cardiobacterium hominis]